jgi:hypothetical protein
VTVAITPFTALVRISDNSSHVIRLIEVMSGNANQLKLLLFSILLVCAMSILYFRFAPDDAYIALAFAKRLMSTGSLAINKGEPINALTSPAWFVISIWAEWLNSITTHKLHPLLFLKLASGLFSVATLVFLYRTIKHSIQHSGLQILAFGLICSDAWFWRWSVAGMESSLATCIVSIAVWLLSRPQKPHPIWVAVTVLCLGSLVRPEFVMFSIVIMVANWRQVYSFLREPKQLTQLVIGAGCMLLPLAIWWWFTKQQAIDFYPQTGQIKRWATSIPKSFWYAARVIGSGQSIAIVCGLFCLIGLSRKKTTLPNHNSVFTTCPEHSTVKTLWGWIFILPLFYILQGYNPLSRYLLLVNICLPIATLMSLEKIFLIDNTKNIKLMPAVIGAVMISVAIWTTVTFTRLTPALGTQWVQTVRSYAQWLNENSPKQTKVATNALGVMAYYLNDRYIVDLGGLVLLLGDNNKRLSRIQALNKYKPQYSIVRIKMKGVDSNLVLQQEVPNGSALSSSLKKTLSLYQLTWKQPKHLRQVGE